MMTDLHAEALDYPADHREAALELLMQNQLLDVQLHGADNRMKTLQDRAWFAGTRLTWAGVAIALVAGVCVFTGLLDGKTTSLIAGGGLFVVLLALLVAAQARRQIERITQQQEAVTEIEAALNGLRNDIDDLELWKATVRVRIWQKLDHRASFETKKDYFILVLGGAILVLMLVFTFTQ
jgi:hypothetical protein